MTQPNAMAHVFAMSPANYAPRIESLQAHGDSRALPEQSRSPVVTSRLVSKTDTPPGASIRGFKDQLNRYFTAVYLHVAALAKTMATSIGRVLQHRFQFLSRIQHAWPMSQN
ncbi:MAG: hypothetical protein VKK59_03125 [Vampirovibrionales bacterium]|nr:hypothetical protein [Vampirovibrionales bacterium]